MVDLLLNIGAGGLQPSKPQNNSHGSTKKITNYKIMKMIKSVGSRTEVSSTAVLKWSKN